MAREFVEVVLSSGGKDRSLLPVEGRCFTGKFSIDGQECLVELKKCDLMIGKTFMKLMFRPARSLCSTSWGERWSILTTKYMLHVQLMEKRGLDKMSRPHTRSLQPETRLCGFCTEGDLVMAATGPTTTENYSYAYHVKIFVKWTSYEPCPASVDTSRLLGSLQKMVDLADVTLVARSKEFVAHSLVLSAHSQVFKAMLTSSMKEGHTKRVEIEDIEPETLEAFIKCMYGADLGPSCGSVGGIVKMMYAADKYNAEELVATGLRYLMELPKLSLEEMMETFLFAYRVSHNELKRRVVSMLLSLGQRDGNSITTNDFAKEFVVNQPEAALDMLFVAGEMLVELQDKSTYYE